VAANSRQKKHLVETTGPDVTQSAHELLNVRQQKYLMVNVIARRARELNKGAKALVEPREGRTITETAMEEVLSDKLLLQRKQKKTTLVSLINNE